MGVSLDWPWDTPVARRHCSCTSAHRVADARKFRSGGSSLISLRDQPRRELGGPDPLDRRIGAPPLSALLAEIAAVHAIGARTGAVAHAGHGVSAARRDPRSKGLQWFTPLVLARLDTAVTIALAVLGVMVGVALARGMRETAACSPQRASRAP